MCTSRLLCKRRFIRFRKIIGKLLLPTMALASNRIAVINRERARSMSSRRAFIHSIFAIFLFFPYRLFVLTICCRQLPPRRHTTACQAPFSPFTVRANVFLFSLFCFTANIHMSSAAIAKRNYEIAFLTGRILGNLAQFVAINSDFSSNYEFHDPHFHHN